MKLVTTESRTRTAALTAVLAVVLPLLIPVTAQAQSHRRSPKRLLPERYSVESQGRIASRDLHYLGAFRLPGRSGASSWQYSGYAMAYRPDGDPDGADDGYPGSLFVLGHDHRQMVAEISIPRPVPSTAKDPSRLETAITLQPFADIRGGLFGELEIPRAGLAVLPSMASGTPARLHFCWGQHLQGFEPSHGWCSLDLSAPQTAGAWLLGMFSNYATNDYLFEIPEHWAAVHVPGQLLATGRFRDGHWSGLGPALFAYDPSGGGDSPDPGARIDSVTPLLLYGTQLPGVPEISSSDDTAMSSFAEADEWSGGAWLTAGERSAVIFVGTKATGRNWYGFSNGVEYPIDGSDDQTPYPEVPPWPHDDRGWWSEGIEARIVFYDTDELAAVAEGEADTWQPQPYAALSIDDRLFDPGFDFERDKRYLLGAAAFDRERGLLYLVERMVAQDDERSLIHVFRVAVRD
jgi:hypothetical protein